jgi:hypothetical protein
MKFNLAFFLPLLSLGLPALAQDSDDMDTATYANTVVEALK